VAQVWRRQTFMAAVDELDPDLARSILAEAMPSTLSVLMANSGSALPKSLSAVLSAAWTFSRMLHATKSNISFGDGDAPSHFRAFVPELGVDLSSPDRVELVKRCDIAMGGGIEKVGACIMLGLVREVPKEIEEHTSGSRRKKRIELQQIVVRRAQARWLCESLGCLRVILFCDYRCFVSARSLVQERTRSRKRCRAVDVRTVRSVRRDGGANKKPAGLQSR
jgi:hypothetical protein